jgi:hypothetical protein
MIKKTRNLALIFAFVILSSFDSGKDTRIPIKATKNPQETFNLTNPGSYYLTSDIYCLDTGIVVYSDNITIDLNGFALIGTQDTGKYYGILLKKIKNVEIKNGTIRDFPNRGIKSFDTIQEIRLLDLRVINNNGCGMCLDYMSEYLIENCIVSSNKGNAFCLGDFGMVKSNIVTNNKGAGIIALKNSIILDNNVNNNGSTGIISRDNSRIEGNTVYNNNRLELNSRYSGISVFSGTIVRNNTMRDNHINCMRIIGNHNVIEDNIFSYSNDTIGIYFRFDKTNNNMIVNNLFSDSTKLDLRMK